MELFTQSHFLAVFPNQLGVVFAHIRDSMDNLKQNKKLLTLTVQVATIDAQWVRMGDVGSARYEPTLLPPCPTIRALSYSNCHRSTHSTYK